MPGIAKNLLFPEFRKEVTKWAVQNKISWILNAGRALVNRMQLLQEEFKKKKKQFKILAKSSDHRDTSDHGEPSRVVEVVELIGD